MQLLHTLKLYSYNLTAYTAYIPTLNLRKKEHIDLERKYDLLSLPQWKVGMASMCWTLGVALKVVIGFGRKNGLARALVSVGGGML